MSLSVHYGIADGFSNRVDGEMTILDYPDDHYTVRSAQKRKVSPASLCQDNNIRITVLGGVVRLAALGRLHTEPELGIPTEHGLRNANEYFGKKPGDSKKDVERRQRASPTIA